MAKHFRAGEYRYFEVCIGKGPDEDPANDTWICVKANPIIMPSREILTKFLEKDLAARPGCGVIGFFMIDEADARGCYDFDDEDRWPVLGGEIQTSLFDEQA